MTALRASGLLAASLVLVPAACTCPAELARAGTIPREEECRERGMNRSDGLQAEPGTWFTG